MEDYLQGLVCGYLTMQSTTRSDHTKRMFVVLSDTRLDHYARDPRPSFDDPVAFTHVFERLTRVHDYVEIHAHAAPHSFCVISDRRTDVYIADSQQEAQVWQRQLAERLEALHQVMRGHLLLRHELAGNQQWQRLWLATKYTWTARSIELGRAVLRYAHGRSTKDDRPSSQPQQQFVLSSQTVVSEEPMQVLRRILPMSSTYRTIEHPDALPLRKLRPTTSPNREWHVREGDVVFPFVISTSDASLHFAAKTLQQREEWITGIRLRVVSLKFHHNAAGDTGSEVHRTLMDVQLAPGEPWAKRVVALEHAMLKIKRNERALGAMFETALVPCCEITPTRVHGHPHALRVSNLAHVMTLAPNSAMEEQHWQELLLKTAGQVSVEQCQRVVDDFLRQVLAASKWYAIEMPLGESESTTSGLVLERRQQRIFVVSAPEPSSGSHQSEGDAVADVKSTNAKPKSKTKDKASAASVPPGSVLTAMVLAPSGLRHETAETIWYQLRQPAGMASQQQQRRTLVFRVPLEKHGLLDVKVHGAAEWTLCRGVLQDSQLQLTRVVIEEEKEAPSAASGVAGPREPSPQDGEEVRSPAAVDSSSSSSSEAEVVDKPSPCSPPPPPLQSDIQAPPAEAEATEAPATPPPPALPDLTLDLRNFQVEMVSIESSGVRNCLRLQLIDPKSVSNRSTSSRTISSVLLRVQHDDDMVLWFAWLHLEASIAQDAPRFPLTRPPHHSHQLKLHQQRKPLPMPPRNEVRREQQRQLRKLTLVGRSVSAIEADAHDNEPKWIDQVRREHRAEVPLIGCERPRAKSSAADPASVVEDVGASAALTENEMQAFFARLDAVGCGKITASALLTTMTMLARHLVSTAQAEVEAVLQSLSVESDDHDNDTSISQVLVFEQVKQILDRLTDLRVLAMLRAYAQHAVLVI